MTYSEYVEIINLPSVQALIFVTGFAITWAFLSWRHNR